MEVNKVSSTKQMVVTALMTALVFLAGSVIKIPTIGGFVHIGDCMVFLSVIVLGKNRGAIASGIGMFLVDAMAGYYIWAPFTFIIKFIMAYITGLLIEKLDGESSNILKFKTKYIIAFIVGGIFMVLGYFIAGGIIAAFFTGHVGLIQGLIVASKDIIGNIIQVVTGIVIAVPLSAIILNAKKIIF